MCQWHASMGVKLETKQRVPSSGTKQRGNARGGQTCAILGGEVSKIGHGKVTPAAKV